MAHEWFRNKSERFSIATKFFPSGPVDVAFKIRSEDFLGAVGSDEGYGRTTDRTTEF